LMQSFHQRSSGALKPPPHTLGSKGGAEASRAAKSGQGSSGSRGQKSSGEGEDPEEAAAAAARSKRSETRYRTTTCSVVPVGPSSSECSLRPPSCHCRRFCCCCRCRRHLMHVRQAASQPMCRRRHRLRLCSRAPKHTHKKKGSHTHTGSVHRVGVPVLRSRRPYHPPRFLRRIRLHSCPQSRDMMSRQFCYWDKLDVEVNPPPLHLSHTSLTSRAGSTVTTTGVTSYPRGQRVCIPLIP